MLLEKYQVRVHLGSSLQMMVHASSHATQCECPGVLRDRSGAKIGTARSQAS